MAAKKKPAAESVAVVAVVRDDRDLADLPELAEELKAGGMTISRVLPLSGMVAGTCAPDAIAALNQKVPRMVVEPEMTVGPA